MVRVDIFCGADIELASELVPKIACPTPLASYHLHCFNNFAASGLPSAVNGVNTGESTAGSVEGCREMVMLSPF